MTNITDPEYYNQVRKKDEYDRKRKEIKRNLVKKHYFPEHKCNVGCPLYTNNHSVNADGYCNMGCC